MSSDSWETPIDLFNELDKEFNFNIDLCATADNCKADFYGDYFELNMENYRNQSCFMNPPYSNPLPFISKAYEDSKHSKIVCLIKVDTSTRWWAVFWDYKTHAPKFGVEVRFFPKRIKFTPPAGLSGGSGPTFPSALVIMDRRGYA